MKELQNQIKESISNDLSAIGIPVSDLRLKKVEGKMKIVPMGELDLQKFCETFKIDNPFLTSVIFNGVERNTEFILTFTARENKSEEAKEALRFIEAKIDEQIEKSLETALEKVKTPVPEYASFEDRIPSKIKGNYEITSDFSKISDWKAKVYLANSRGRDEPDVGGMGSVGYTMIDVDNEIIIPIARSDEHNMGYDLIRHLISKKQIPKGSYYPIYRNNNYVYSEYPDEVSKALKAFKIWRANGGENTLVTNNGNVKFDYSMKMDDFIKANGKVDLPVGELFPMGQRIVRYLEKCATLIRAFHEGKTIKADQVAGYAQLIIAELDGSYKFMSEIKALQEAITKFKTDANLKFLEEALFSHNGFKNEIHMAIRRVIEDPKDFNARDILKIFGDAEMANREFNRLAMI